MDSQRRLGPVAAVIASGSAQDRSEAVIRLLDFFGVPAQTFKDCSEVRQAAIGPLRKQGYSVIGPMTGLEEFFQPDEEFTNGLALSPQSIFCYLDDHLKECERLLQLVLRPSTATLRPFGNVEIEAAVSTEFPEITAALHGLQVSLRPAASDYGLACDPSSALSTIIEAGRKPCFFEIKERRIRTFVSCSRQVPDPNNPLKGRYYDVKDNFLSVVPFVTFIKWAFADSCWRSGEAGACLIIDDPVLRMRYGCCDFERIDSQMREIGFTTNISFIPWNWRRTSDTTAKLIRNSNGRLSISVHGCDHTGSEFATSNKSELNRRVILARRRMEEHRSHVGVAYDPVMVFPRGEFTRESLDALRQHQFLAAVNTELRPVSSNGESITIGDTWSVAILRYGGFPLFSRRYPAHGLENFAFDLLLGKPCLIVEHHSFFKDGGREAAQFMADLNSLNCRLYWRSLGEVLRRSYQWRVTGTTTVDVRMFAGELSLQNRQSRQIVYRIGMPSVAPNLPELISVNGQQVHWVTQNSSITFTLNVEPNSEVLVRAQYLTPPDSGAENNSFGRRAETAMRRYLSEFRDYCLSVSAGPVFLARKAKPKKRESRNRTR